MIEKTHFVRGASLKLACPKFAVKALQPVLARKTECTALCCLPMTLRQNVNNDDDGDENNDDIDDDDALPALESAHM